MDIRALGYVRLQSTVVQEWSSFASEVLGLMVTSGTDPANLYLRLDDHAARVVVAPGATDEVTASGWEVADQRALELAAEELDRAGFAPGWGGPEACDERGVEAFFAFRDPAGNPLELHHSPMITHEPLQLGGGVSGFVTGTQGLGHVVLPAGDLAETFDFYTRVLGFVHRDSMIVSPPGVEPYRMRFLACNGRHHSVALTEAESPRGLRHLMINAATVGDVGCAYDRCRKFGSRLKTTVGQHSNDLMFSFYLYTPGGFEVEYATGGEDIDNATWSARTLNEFRLWGYEPIS